MAAAMRSTLQRRSIGHLQMWDVRRRALKAKPIDR
jgi:hypothetical protein